jgi:hypothetical protein
MHAIAWHRSRVSLHLGALGTCGALLIALGGCGLEEPQSPTWEASYVLPLVNDQWDAAEMLAELDTAFVTTEGVPESLGIDLTSELTPVSFAEALLVGASDEQFLATLSDLDLQVEFAATPARYTFADLFPEIDQGVGVYSGPVVPFVFDNLTSVSGPSAYEWIEVAHGAVRLQLANTLPVPLFEPSRPPAERLVQLRNSGGELLGEQVIESAVAPGDTLWIVMDVSGKRIERVMEVRVVGSSPGSSGEAVSIDPEAPLNIGLDIAEALEPSAFRGEPPASSGRAESRYEIDVDFAIETATVGSGELELGINNGFPFAFDYEFTIPTYLHGGVPLTASGHLDALQREQITLQLAGVEIVPEGDNQALVVVAEFTSEDRTGHPVEVDEGNLARIDVTQTEVQLSRVTGRMTAPYEVDPEEIDTGLGDVSPGFLFVDPRGTVRLDSLPAALTAVDMVIAAPEGSPLLHVRGSIPAEGGEIALDPAELALFLANPPARAISSGTVEMAPTRVTLEATDAIAGRLHFATVMHLVVEGRSDTLDTETVDDIDSDLRDILLDRVLRAAVLLRVENQVPLGVAVEVGLDPDADAVVTHPAVLVPADAPLEVPAPAVDAGARPTAPAIQVQRIEITPDELHTLLTGDTFYASTRLQIHSSEGEAVWIYSDDLVKVAAQLEVTALLGELE